MKASTLLFAAVLFAGMAAPAAYPKDDPSAPRSVTPLRNADVLRMVERQLAPEVIVSVIKASPCTFDTFPPVMQDLKRRGVSDAVLQAMLEAPYGPYKNGGAGEMVEAPIYHYAEQLKQLNLINNSAAPRAARRGISRARARASGSSSRRRL